MLLFTPGPTPTKEAIRNEMAKPSIHHRTPEFSLIFNETRDLLKELFDMPEVLILSCSGTGALEASVTTFAKKKALIINSGKFGERFSKIAKSFNIEYDELKYDWNTPVDIDDVKSMIVKNDYDSVFVQVCESSGGVRHPVEKLASTIKNINSDIYVVADAITAIGVEKIDVTNIDVLISGSQKALALPPGVALLGLSNYALKNLDTLATGFYFNLATELKKQKQNTTAWTPAISIIIGLRAVLKEFKEIGFENIYEKTKKISYATKSAIKTIGFELYPKKSAVCMTSVKSPRASDIISQLKVKYEVALAGGQDHLKGEIFRINHMGDVNIHEAVWVVNAIELTLDDMNIRPFNGEANKVFNEIYFA
ncbi:MAG: Aminotransferase [uncultured Campylobacterales bacterium]|uniref:Aminotransferase n=1 Tax=uncultured Campylobacterales bacterium TaxID=352960 RepID=A0A6S6S7K3_9BACT|nr:MAG: Aminotransferase [uncultured Campylobacterales bacterium]